MKVLLLSHHGDLLPLALKLLREGHTCSLHTHLPQFRVLGEGLVEKCEPRGLLLTKQGEAVAPHITTLLNTHLPELVITDEKLGVVGDYIRASGTKSWGSSRFGDLASSQQDYANNLIRIAHLAPEKELQGGWWNGSYFTCLFSAHLYFGFLTGGLGPPTLEGLSLRPLRGADVVKFSSLLAKTKHVGPFLFGASLYAAYHSGVLAALLELLEGDFLRALSAEHPALRKEVALAIHATLPAYPYSSLDKQSYSPEPASEKHVWHVGISEGWAYSNFAWVTARGIDAREARRRAYRTLSRLREKLPTLQFRLDIGE